VPTAADLRKALRRVLTIARPVRRRFIGAAGLGTAAELCTIGLAGAAAWLIVRAAEQPDLAALSLAILGVRAFGTGKGVFRYAERLATHDTGLRSLSEIRAAVVARLAEIAPAGIPGWQRGDLVQRVVADVDRLLDLFVRVLGPVVAVAVTAIGALVITVAIDATVGLVLLASLLVVGVVVPAVTMRGEGSIGPALTDARAALGGRVLAVTEGLDQLWANRMFAAARRDVDGPGELIDDLERGRARLRMLTGAVVTAAPLADGHGDPRGALGLERLVVGTGDRGAGALAARHPRTRGHRERGERLRAEHRWFGPPGDHLARHPRSRGAAGRSATGPRPSDRGARSPSPRAGREATSMRSHRCRCISLPARSPRSTARAVRASRRSPPCSSTSWRRGQATTDSTPRPSWRQRVPTSATA
jgi:hypothetical protein